MSKVETYQCDVCGRHKRDANHWFRGYKLLEGGVTIVPWETKLDVAHEDAHLCGADCTIQWLSRNLL